MYPADLRRREMEAAVIPFPIPEITPPETKIYFTLTAEGLVLLFLSFDRGTINVTKKDTLRQIATFSWKIQSEIKVF